MLISHKKKFIYTKTHKTAGTSVESYFERYCMKEYDWELTGFREMMVSNEGIIGYRGHNPIGKLWYNHMPASEIRDKIGSTIWDDYFKFCVVRNPFDRLVSMFYFINKDIEFDDSIESFRKWIQTGVIEKERIKYMEKYIIDDAICVDYFIRYENLLACIKEVCDRIDVPYEPDRIPKFKAGFRDRSIKLIDFYDDKTIKVVEAVYKKELDYFDYRLPSVKST